MDTETAVKNIDGLIAQSRMTRQDHLTLQESLECLKQKAITFDAEKEGMKDAEPIGQPEDSE